MIQAIIFDCFGVVISDALEVLSAELRKKDPETARQVRDVVQASNRGMVAPAEASRQIAELLGFSYEQYRQHIADGELKNAELLAYIGELKAQYKIGMLSNIGMGGLARRFELGELERYFDVVVASGDIGYAKPEAEAYEITADRLGVRLDECVFTDDREGYCEAARGVGMQAILYKDLDQFRTDLETLLSLRGA
jgi:putative hydrolase of the HAD superfamily